MASYTSISTAIDPNLLVGKKLKREHEQSFREHVSAPTSAFAKKQLEKMGWSEGTGLGKNRDGMISHIKVKRRKDQLGLGGSDKPEIIQAMGDSEWWKDSVGSTLAKLGKKKDKNSKKKDKKSKKDKVVKSKAKTYTDEELFQATGGARFGMRAGITNNLHKWVRTEKTSDASGEKEAIETAVIQAEEELRATLDNETGDKDTNGSKSSDNDEKAKRKRDKKEKKKRKRDEAETTDISKDSAAAVDEEELSKKEKKKAKKDRKKKSKAKE